MSEMNGTVPQLAKYGVLGAMCTVLCTMLWLAALAPAIEERKVQSETHVRSVDAMEKVGHASDKISDTMVDIKDEIKAQTDLRITAMDTMSTFAIEMRTIHPANDAKLDLLLQAAAEHSGSDSEKLDTIIEKLEALNGDNP